jgi:hypothetical protein
MLVKSAWNYMSRKFYDSSTLYFMILDNQGLFNDQMWSHRSRCDLSDYLTS